MSICCVATVVYTIPELARVGLLEADAHQTDIDLDVRYRDTSSWFSNYRIGETTAAAKIVVDRNTDTIVGAHYSAIREEFPPLFVGSLTSGLMPVRRRTPRVLPGTARNGPVTPTAFAATVT